MRRSWGTGSDLALSMWYCFVWAFLSFSFSIDKQPWTSNIKMLQFNFLNDSSKINRNSVNSGQRFGKVTDAVASFTICLVFSALIATKWDDQHTFRTAALWFSMQGTKIYLCKSNVNSGLVHWAAHFEWKLLGFKSIQENDVQLCQCIH